MRQGTHGVLAGSAAGVFSVSPAMPVHTTAVLLGLLAALTWGAADFAGGLATRRAAPSQVVLVAQGLSLPLLAGFSLPAAVQLPPWAIVGGILSGVAGGGALMLFYEALSLGAMGLSAALAGLLTAILQVALALRTEGAPPSPQLVGFGVAAAAIGLIAYAPRQPGSSARPDRRRLLLATVAGLGFGLQLIWLHTAAAAGTGSSTASVLRALVLSRIGGTAVALAALLLAGRRSTRGRSDATRERSKLRPTPPRSLSVGVLLTALLTGLLDTAGNGLYMLSSLSGRLDVAAVLSSLYPASTIVLAAVFLRERATRLQTLGMAFALLAVILIAH